MKKLIGNGAEALIYKEHEVVFKERIPKEYRIPVLDKKLRISRTRREKKILDKLASYGFVPTVTAMSDTSITLEFISGKKVRDVLTKKTSVVIASEIGACIGLMHSKDIIHGDLTTSNMIFNSKVYIIDFGLSYVSTRVEDKAVDLHVLKQALEAYHYAIADDVFSILLQSYLSSYSLGSVVLDRLRVVEKRGKNKH